MGSHKEYLKLKKEFLERNKDFIKPDKQYRQMVSSNNRGDKMKFTLFDKETGEPITYSFYNTKTQMWEKDKEF